MRRIAVANQKGGVGKTTTAVNLAAGLAELGKRVLVVDLDPQGSATAWLGRVASKGLYEVLSANGDIVPHVADTVAEGVDLVPSSPWLMGAERALAGEVGAELVLRRAFDALPARWDFLLVDTPPSLGLLAVAALAAVRELVVPVEVSTMALAGLAGLLATVERVRERLNPELDVAAIVPCRVDYRRNLAGDVEAELRKRFPDQVTATVIRETVRLAEAPSFQKPITTYATSSTGAEDYRALARELAKRSPRRRNRA